MEKHELDERRDRLLGEDRHGDVLRKAINRLLRDKGLSAVCDGVKETTAGLWPGQVKIDVSLDGYGKPGEWSGDVSIWLPVAIYEEDGFAVIDKSLPKGMKIDDRVLLRALRATFEAIREIHTEAGVDAWALYKDEKIGIVYDENGILHCHSL